MKNDLLRIMDELVNGLSKLKNATQEKQKALIANNYEALEIAIHNEEKFLSSLQAIHKNRGFLLAEIKKELTLNIPKNKFTDFIYAIRGKVERDFLNKLIERNMEVEKAITEINAINLQNKFLTEQASEFNRSLMNELFAGRQKSLLDRKI